jgi:hypothetical protein
MSQDFPLPQIATAINDLAAKGWNCYVRWTCAGCGVRCTADEPNVVYASYRHDEGCGHVTYLKGANYLAIHGPDREAIRAMMARERGN